MTAREDLRLEAAINECIRLFTANNTGNPVDTAMRLRACVELTRGITTEDLVLLTAAVAKANAAGDLRGALETYLAGCDALKLSG